MVAYALRLIVKCVLYEPALLSDLYQRDMPAFVRLTLLECAQFNIRAEVSSPDLRVHVFSRSMF